MRISHTQMQLSPRPQFQYYGSPQIYLEIAKSVLAGKQRSGEQYLEALESWLAEWTGARYSLCLPSGRLGLYLALRCLIRPGQKVVLSPYTIFDVVNMVICAGGRPVFADIKPETCNIDPRQVKELVDNDTGAVIATHLHGLACDIEEISEICRARGVPLIEDCAQCLGGQVGGRHVGTFGDVGVFSLSLKKNVNTLSGGFLVTSDDMIHDRIRDQLASFPFEKKRVILKGAAKCLVGDILTIPPVFQILTFWLVRYAYLLGGQLIHKFTQPETRPQLIEDLPEQYRRRMTPLQARLALLQIENIDQDMQTRLKYARSYCAGLSERQDIGLPPLREDASHTYLAFPIQSANRQQLVKHIMSRNCDVRIQSFTNVADQPCFSAYARDCPHARQTADRVVLLPTYPGYGEVEVNKMIAAIRSYPHR